MCTSVRRRSRRGPGGNNRYTRDEVPPELVLQRHDVAPRDVVQVIDEGPAAGNAELRAQPGIDRRPARGGEVPLLELVL
jgi:hypothetical protein